MLVHLDVRDFAIVDRLELELEPGMTVLTGETGAGKSILVDALGLALGDRATSACVRAGRDRAEVSAVFELASDAPAQSALSRNELDEPGGECVLRRTVSADGRSRAFVNGRPTPVHTLRSIGDLLVDIHGQHAHHSLLRREVQRDLLDGFAGHDDLLAAVAGHHERWREADRRLAELCGDGVDVAARLDYLRYQVAELARLDVSPEALEAMEAEHRRLAHVHDLSTGAREALEHIDAEDEAGALDRLDGAARRLAALGNLDRRLADVGRMLEAAAAQGREAASDLRHYLDGLDADPERLALVESRMADVHDAARKHRVPAAELPALLERMRTEVDDLEHAGERVAALTAERDSALGAYAAAAQRLHRSRADAATSFAEVVEANLHELGMERARFAVEVEADPAVAPSRHGADAVEFAVSANPGQPLQPITRVASGGELARISLAIQVVATGATGVPTLIFDEVDVGVGGRHAEIVGRRLHQLSERRQVLCVTHLAQVAAIADHHVRVTKRSDRDSTRARMEPLHGESRLEEVARMLGGMEVTRTTLAHARDLLERR